MSVVARAAGLLALAALLAASGAQAQGAPAACPDLAGHYRVDGFGPVLGDALEALQAKFAGFTDSEVRIGGEAASKIELSIKSGSTGRMPAFPGATLYHGVDYTCENRTVVLRRAVRSSRPGSQGYLEGESSVRLARPSSGAGLQISTVFTGGQRTTVYSYDSARVSLPKLGTRETLRESIRWPDISEPVVREPRREPPPPEAAQVAVLRKRLEPLLGSVRLNVARQQEPGVAVILSANRSEDVVAFEDRLHQAGVLYEVRRQPIWSNNMWQMEFVMPASSAAATPPTWRPSLLRAEHELTLLRHPGSDVMKVESAPNGYLATLVLRGVQPDEVLARFRRLSTVLADVSLEPDAELPVDGSTRRVVKARLSFR